MPTSQPHATLSTSARSMLLIFACLANLLMIGALVRLRWVMQQVLDDIGVYDGKRRTKGNYTIVMIFSAMLLFTAIGSSIAARDPAAYFTKAPAAKAGD